jgi:hypothetical protein
VYHRPENTLSAGADRHILGAQVPKFCAVGADAHGVETNDPDCGQFSVWPNFSRRAPMSDRHGRKPVLVGQLLDYCYLRSQQHPRCDTAPMCTGAWRAMQFSLGRIEPNEQLRKLIGH